MLAVVIPWRGGQPDRDLHHQHVSAYLTGLLPYAIHLDVDSGATPFSRAGSRNLGVDLAISRGADVVVLCDADTLPEKAPLEAAIAGAVDGRLHLPYTKFRGLSQLSTKAYLSGVPAENCRAEQESDWSTGGCMVMTPSAYKAAGEMDERFTGWGFEDSCYRISCDAILGSTVRHEGVLSHLWHPSACDPTSADYLANAALAARYVETKGDADAVKVIVAERQVVPA